MVVSKGKKLSRVSAASVSTHVLTLNTMLAGCDRVWVDLLVPKIKKHSCLFQQILRIATFAAHLVKGPSIYDVHTEGGGGSGSGGRMWTGGGPAPCGRPHRKLKLRVH